VSWVSPVKSVSCVDVSLGASQVQGRLWEGVPGISTASQHDLTADEDFQCSQGQTHRRRFPFSWIRGLCQCYCSCLLAVSSFVFSLSWQFYIVYVDAVSHTCITIKSVSRWFPKDIKKHNLEVAEAGCFTFQMLFETSSQVVRQLKAIFLLVLMKFSKTVCINVGIKYVGSAVVTIFLSSVLEVFPSVDQVYLQKHNNIVKLNSSSSSAMRDRCQTSARHHCG